MAMNSAKTISSLSVKRFLFYITVVIFVFLTAWWLWLFLKQSEWSNLVWAASYQTMALWGGILGLFLISRLWGGLKSVMGRAVTWLAIGLLLQVFGQSVFSFYNIVFKIEIPYPSLADIGFFGSIPFYIYGIILLGKASRVTISLKSFGNKLQAVIIPLAILAVSYYSFLRDYEFDFSNPLRIFLDFGYPLSQATYVSIAILVYILSRNILGGIMKNKILLILAALAVQYVADYNFLYQTIRETWMNGGYGDYIYLCAYFLMSLALVNLMSIFDQSSEE